MPGWAAPEMGVDEGPHKGESGDKIEFGHYLHLGPMLGVFDFPSCFICLKGINRMGMDCTQFGWNLAMAMELLPARYFRL